MPYQYQEGYFRSFDQTELFYRVYLNRDDDADLMLVLHGLGEHSGRYAEYPVALENERLSFAMFDYRGHGRSRGTKFYVDSFRDYLKDVSAFHQFLGIQYREAESPVVYGHSVGALVAVHWAAINPHKSRALFLSSPCFELLTRKIVLDINYCVNKIMPKYEYRNPVVTRYLSHDPKEVENYEKDPLIERKISARLAEELYKACQALDKEIAQKLEIPVFMMLAGDDRIVNSQKSVRFYQWLRGPQKAIQVFPDFYHEVFHEERKEEAFKCFKQFIRNYRDKGEV